MRAVTFGLCVLSFMGVASGAAPLHKTRNVILVMSDGVRWQDVFTGADPQLMNEENGHVRNIPQLRADFWKDDPQARREALMPFLWNVVAKQGQIYGNRALNSDVQVTNGKNFSYPGYSELLCGFADPRIDSNDNKPNPNATVLEWLSQKAEYRKRIAAFGSWETFPFILNVARSGLFVNAGYEPLPEPKTPQLDLLSRIKIETGVWQDETLDGAVFPLALSYFKFQKPRILFVGLGDTDEWAHDARYDMYLKAMHRFDQYARELWETAQSMAEYRGKTTLILAVDHGRGAGPKDWPGHGLKHPDSKDVWFAFMGPDTPPLGERARIPALTESQVAATLAALLGEDYHSAVPQSGEPIANAYGR
jgi:hypothetical protein